MAVWQHFTLTKAVAQGPSSLKCTCTANLWRHVFLEAAKRPLLCLGKAKQPAQQEASQQLTLCCVPCSAGALHRAVLWRVPPGAQQRLCTGSHTLLHIIILGDIREYYYKWHSMPVAAEARSIV